MHLGGGGGGGGGEGRHACVHLKIWIGGKLLDCEGLIMFITRSEHTEDTAQDVRVNRGEHVNKEQLNRMTLLALITVHTQMVTFFLSVLQ